MFKSASKQGLPAVCVGAHALFRSSAVPSPPFLKAFDFGGQAGVCFVSLPSLLPVKWWLYPGGYFHIQLTCLARKLVGWSCVVVVDSQMDP